MCVYNVIDIIWISKQVIDKDFCSASFMQCINECKKHQHQPTTNKVSLSSVILATAALVMLIGCALVGGQEHTYFVLKKDAVISRHGVEKDLQLLDFLECLASCKQLKTSYCAYKVSKILKGGHY